MARRVWFVFVATTAPLVSSACVPGLCIDDADCADGELCCAGACTAGDCVGAGPCVDPGTDDATAFSPLAADSAWAYDVRDVNGAEKTHETHRMAALGDDAEQERCREITKVDDAGARFVAGGSVRTFTKANGVTRTMREIKFDFEKPTKIEIDLPFNTTLDERAPHLCAGARYRETWVQRTPLVPCTARTFAESRDLCFTNGVVDTPVTHTWTVDGVDVPVVATAFGDVAQPALQVTRLSERPGIAKTTTFWFVRGIGKVREEGEDVEDLLAVSVHGLRRGTFEGEIDHCDAAWVPQLPATRSWPLGQTTR